MNFDRQAAKKAGYSDAEIDAFLQGPPTPPASVGESRGEVVPRLPIAPKPQIDRVAAKAAGYTEQEITAFEQGQSPEAQVRQQAPADLPFPVTQEFGPSQYDYLSGGFNYGVDFATPEGTEINLPEDDWDVEESYAGGDFNQGYGNTLVVKNARTGEKLRFEHLQDIDPKLSVGSRTRGGLVARSGNTGNSTGPHSSVPYWNTQGEPADILQSPYAASIFSKK